MQNKSKTWYRISSALTISQVTVLRETKKTVVVAAFPGDEHGIQHMKNTVNECFIKELDEALTEARKIHEREQDKVAKKLETIRNFERQIEELTRLGK